ncbi:head completion/stabilization protein [Serratia ficaria]|uniref:head completion/stabilization protein n=1 Tax=Serratia ficaria TaxID=61651 RepID=UPI00217A7D01|nr:head completion/stabilization protein [Serratia ficaria]CAI0901013.1 Phage head completion protein (GPL) [Serratia ficaria]CAI2420031.1 Phage head completion protein (GPL) [Serratia ficaria]CAI2432890.1 Phage head completion protein (GPL) [Serratia ficaria]CAI2520613.1 Phage head completion protein (GPL) [Serratia ficaria]
MSIVIHTPRPDAPAPRPEDEPIVKNIFFFPDIRPAEVRDVMRIEGTITAPRLRLAIKSAMAEVNAELFTFRRDQMADGYQRLEDVPGDKIDGESVRVSEYRNAVSAMTMATLSEQYRSLDTTTTGGRKADVIEASIGELWRNARNAINNVAERSHCIIGLL